MTMSRTFLYDGLGCYSKREGRTPVLLVSVILPFGPRRRHSNDKCAAEWVTKAQSFWKQDG